ncbi:TetR/AcrR family transcriptional regulator [Rhodoblastus sp.]|uniref:TetR/AcrR family transcriptional regulator n=1 Tax=Rhodoblastus sp. TaxID=1962975 RepID=UPI003F978055
MASLKAFLSQNDLSTPALCGEIFDRHQDTINVKKRHVAVAKLARIIPAALSISNERGFRAMSLRDLAKEADLSMGALYAYFDSKETLLMMILLEVQAVVLRVLQVPPDLAGDPAQRLRWLIRTHIYLTEAMHSWFIFSFMEVRAFDERARKFILESEMVAESLFFDALAEGKRKGVFKINDVQMTSALIKPMLQDWYIKRWKHRRRKITPDDYADFLTSFIEAAIVRSASSVWPDADGVSPSPCR